MKATTWSNDDQALLPWEMMEIAAKRLNKERAKLIRTNARGQELGYLDRSDDGIDHQESARDFLQTIEDFTNRKAHEAVNLRKLLGLREELKKSQGKPSTHKQHSEYISRKS